MKAQQTALLDAGGIILDETEIENYYAGLTCKILSENGVRYGLDDYWKDIDEAVITFCPKVYQFTIWKHMNGDRRNFDLLWKRFSDESAKNRPALKLNDGIGKEISELKSYFKIGIAGQYGKELLELLERERLIELFDYRVTQDGFEITKPDPRYVEGIMNKCGIKASDTIMVGDRIDKDIVPASYLGMKSVLVRLGIHIRQMPRIPEEIPDLEVVGISGLARAMIKKFRPQE